jgi:AcrR family transcriptional regulator
MFAAGDAQPSLRAITGAAGVSAGVVHYHFGSREGLLRSLILRRMVGIRAEQNERLDRAFRAHEPALEEVLDAFFEPLLSEVPKDPVLRGMAAAIVGDLEVVRDFRANLADHIVGRLRQALLGLLTHLRPDESSRRVEIAMGVASQHIHIRAALGEDDPFVPRTTDVIAFIAAGLRAPTTSDENGKDGT